MGSIVAYRISPFHPLAKYPGPFTAKLSKLWMVRLSVLVGVIEADKHSQVFVTLTGKQHEHFASLHEKYGDIVRTGESPPS
jgi:hypothetical protein